MTFHVINEEVEEEEEHFAIASVEIISDKDAIMLNTVACTVSKLGITASYRNR